MKKPLIVGGLAAGFLALAPITKAAYMPPYMMYAAGYSVTPYTPTFYHAPRVQPFYQVNPYGYGNYGRPYIDQVRGLTQGNLNFVGQFQFVPSYYYQPYRYY